MSDRTLCDSTAVSKSLPKLTPVAFSLFPYIFQQTDDFGCLEVNPVLIKSQRFPLISWVTPEMIRDCLHEYQSHEVKMLFIWTEKGHWYGHFVGFEGKSGKYLSRRRKSDIPTPPADELAKYLNDNNHFQTLPIVETLPKSSYKLSQVKLKRLKDTSAPSAVSVDNLLTTQNPIDPPIHKFTESVNSAPDKNPGSGTPENQVEEFLSDKTGFGDGGKNRDMEFRDEVQKVCTVYVRRLKEWQLMSMDEDERKAVNARFGLMMNLIKYGVGKIPKGVRNFKGFFTEPKTAIELINRMSKPQNPVGELCDAFRRQPKYLH